MSVKNIYIDVDSIVDFVIMNEDLCFHKTVFKDGNSFSSFAKPEYVYLSQKKTHDLQVEIFCPVCHRKYFEATKRFSKNLIYNLSKKKVYK